MWTVCIFNIATFLCIFIIILHIYVNICNFTFLFIYVRYSEKQFKKVSYMYGNGHVNELESMNRWIKTRYDTLNLFL